MKLGKLYIATTYQNLATIKAINFHFILQKSKFFRQIRQKIVDDSIQYAFPAGDVRLSIVKPTLIFPMTW